MLLIGSQIKNIEAYNDLSMLLRSSGKGRLQSDNLFTIINFFVDAKAVLEQLRQSIDLAKEALALDIKDAKSWCK